MPTSPVPRFPGTTARFSTARGRVARRTWVGLAAAAVVVLLAGVLGNALGALVPDDDVAGDFAISHLIPLPIEIVLLLFFARWSGWGRDLWREPPTPTLRPRRWWLLSFPILAFLLPASQLGDVPWADRTAAFVVLIAVGTLMVGFTEELTVRGVLLTAVRGRHGELVALLVTSAVFALMHVPSDVINGVPLPVIAFQFLALASVGSTYYWVRRVTGNIWPAMAIHAFTDWTLYLASGSNSATSALTSTTETGGGSPVTVAAQSLLLILGLVGIVSVAREDHRSRRQTVA